MADSENGELAGLRIAAFESRRGEDLARLIQRRGGEAFVSASMQEVPLSDDREAREFASSLVAGEFQLVIFMTGVGFRFLLEAACRAVEREAYLRALADCTLVARGPKPMAAMKEVGLQADVIVPSPNTWKELLAEVDRRQLDLTTCRVAVQQYGAPNPELTAGLKSRGAEVVDVSVYRWDLPADIGPLQDNVNAICNGQRDVALFTSAHQVENIWTIAEQLAKLDELLVGLRQLVVASVGPTTTEALHSRGIRVDVEPQSPKMGALVAEIARHGPRLFVDKHRPQTFNVVSAAPSRAEDDQGSPRPAWDDGPFMKACRREPTDVTPVWLMRQAGRYMAEYRAVREKTTFLELCKNPQLCSEVMVTAVEKLGVDAAIIFSDLLPILEPMGLELEFAKGEGPVIHNPVREVADVDRILELEDMGPLQFVADTVRQTRADMDERLPVIGFAGAPFTLASYAIEGGGSRNYLHTKKMMLNDSGAWRELMGRFARSVTLYLNAQIDAGAQCVQLFDSWVGCLGVDDYRQFVLPYVQSIIAGLRPGVPVINFGTGNPALMPLYAEVGADVVGVDWRMRLDQAWSIVGEETAVQGNLDPATLLADTEQIRQRAIDVLQQAAGRPGHIFNLGHGIVPETPVENAIALVQIVHEESSR